MKKGRFVATETAWIQTFAMALAIAATAAPVRSATIFESAPLVRVGEPLERFMSQELFGANINHAVFFGVRFQVAGPTRIERIGGNFVRIQPGPASIFGALVALTGSADVPDTGDLSSADVLATTLIYPGPVSGDAFGDLGAIVPAGWYALVFGGADGDGGLFGSTGAAVAPLEGVANGSPTFFAIDSTTLPGPHRRWHEERAFFDTFRFVAQGRAIPEPASALLIALATASALRLQRRRRLLA